MKRFISICLIILGVGLLPFSSQARAQAQSFSEQMKGNQHQFLLRTITAAGSGKFDYQNGADLQASFRLPSGLLLLPDGSLLVADSDNNLIRKISKNKVTTFAGFLGILDVKNYSPIGTLLDGTKGEAMFNHPEALGMDSQGNIIVADSGNNAIRKITKEGVVTTIAGDGVAGSQDGTGYQARFDDPTGIAVAKDGTIYVADTLNNLIRKISPGGKVTTLNEFSKRKVTLPNGSVHLAGDYRDGDLKQALFNEPTGLVLDNHGDLYVSDSGNQIIRKIQLQKGQVSTIAGQVIDINKVSMYKKDTLYAAGGFRDGDAQKAQFSFPKGLSLTKEGGILVADSMNHSIRYIFNGQVTTIAGDPSQLPGHRDGIDRYAQFNIPTDIKLAANGDLWVADSYNQEIRKIHFFHLPKDLTVHQSPQFVLDGKLINMGQTIIVKGRVRIAASEWAERMDSSIQYNERHTKVTLIKNNQKVVFTTGEKQYLIESNSKKMEKSMDVACYSQAGKVMIPLRFAVEALDMDIQWSEQDRTVIIRHKK